MRDMANADVVVDKDERDSVVLSVYLVRTSCRWWSRPSVHRPTNILSVNAVIFARLATMPAHLFQADFPFNEFDFAIFLTIEMHLCVTNAAYRKLLSFLRKASTGFMSTTPGIVGSRGTRSATDHHSAGGPPLRLRRDVQHRRTASVYRDKDGISLESFNSQTIIISRSVTVVDAQ